MAYYENDSLLKIAQLAVPELKTLKVRDGDALKHVYANQKGLKEAVRIACDLGWHESELAAKKSGHKA